MIRTAAQGFPLRLPPLFSRMIPTSPIAMPSHSSLRVRIPKTRLKQSVNSGTVATTTAAMPDGTETPVPRARLIVEDSGPGLSPEHLQRLGERFFRALGNDRPGSGLGWSIVRRIAMALQLDIQVDRSPDLGGLRVSVAVAMAPQEPEPESTAAASVAAADQPERPSGPPPEPERSRT